MTRRRALLVFWTVGLFACSTSTPAIGAVETRLNETGKWPAREMVLSLPSKQVLNDDDVTVTENGRRVRGVSVISEAENPKRGVILAIDASLTMRGEPIRQAMVAARSFAKRRSPATRVGVIYFSRSPRVALAPTSDVRRLNATLAVGPALTRGTKIFDAASAGIDALKKAGLTSGAIVVLSDGAEAERGSTTTPAALAAEAREASVRIFSVGLSSRSFDDTSLRSMASSTGGRYGEAARPRDLPPLFAAIGDRLSSEYRVAYQSTVPAGSRVQVITRIEGSRGASVIRYRAPALLVPEFGPDTASANDGLNAGRVLLLAVGGFLVTTLVLFLLLMPKRRSLVSRVADFAGVTQAAALPTMEDVRETKEREPSDRWRRYAETIELADIGISPAALAMWTTTGTVLFAWYFVFAAERPALVVFAVVIPVVVRTVVILRLNARRRQFEDQLPDNLQVLASAMRAGYSFSAALASMAEDSPEPSRTEFLRVSTDEQLGVDIADAMQVVSQRMDCQEVEYVGIVAKMQREAGGNTAEILDQVIATIRSRQQLKRMVRVLTAQGRMGGAIISAMPVVMGVGMATLHPGYFDPMFESFTGIVLFVAGGFMLLTGWLVIRKIVDVEP